MIQERLQVLDQQSQITISIAYVTYPILSYEHQPVW